MGFSPTVFFGVGWTENIATVERHKRFLVPPFPTIWHGKSTAIMVMITDDLLLLALSEPKNSSKPITRRG